MNFQGYPNHFQSRGKVVELKVFDQSKEEMFLDSSRDPTDLLLLEFLHVLSSPFCHGIQKQHDFPQGLVVEAKPHMRQRANPKPTS